MQYSIKRIWDTENKEWLDFLQQSNIRAEKTLDYTVGIYSDEQLIATGSLYKNMIKCIAVSCEYQGGAVFSQLLSHLLDELFERKYEKVFVYTKPVNVFAFEQLNFKVIDQVGDELVFLERAMHGFKTYIDELTKQKVDGEEIAAIVMNANPFTKGHQYLIEKASSENDVVHVFVVSEDASIFPTHIRIELIKKGTAHLTNVYIHETDDYIVSRQTFPSYFLPEDANVTKIQATLDANIFVHAIGPALGITARYVGEEPLSIATAIYNEALQEAFVGVIDLHIVPRIETTTDIISASKVRQLLGEQKIEDVQAFVPQTTFDFLHTIDGQKIIEKLIREKK